MPDAVLSGDTPIDVQAHLLHRCRRQRIGFVHWVQDDYGMALDFMLRGKIGGAARIVTLPFRKLDGWVARNSSAVVSISPGFAPRLRRLGVQSESLAVIENWAPLNELPPMPRNNPWGESLGLNGKPVFLYSGSMGLKHCPNLIYLLAKATLSNAWVVVVSEGVGRHYLANQPRLSNLRLLDFQPYERLPEILATADVLLATLQEDAGEFAVPSKVLTYLCAGRPVLLAAPFKNLAADVVRRSGGGVVVDPKDATAWIEAGQKLAADAERRTSLGLCARHYAESNFEIEKIADRFEALLIGAARRPPDNPGRRGRNGASSAAAAR
jgi:glycosyltransferase involved in cell wall biosynthesis